MMLLFLLPSLIETHGAVNSGEHQGLDVSGVQGSELTLVPGETILLDFPGLGPMAKRKPAQCEVSIPKSYDPARPTPLFLWYSGGLGSHLTEQAQGLVDFDRFIVVALPYPGGQKPRLAASEGEDAIDAFWNYQRPMLERIKTLIPNISEEVRIVGGSSSGAHLVGSGLDRDWDGFCNYFTAFILHEGGTSPGWTYKGGRASHRHLVIYGARSPHRDYQQNFISKFSKARGQITTIEVENAGHGLNPEVKRLIFNWIEKECE